MNRELSKILNKIDWLAIAANRVRILNDHYALAKILHKQECYYNHTDGCAWYYNKGRIPWHDATYFKWLERACRLLGKPIPSYVLRRRKAENRIFEKMDSQ